MFPLDIALIRALTTKPERCRIPYEAPASYYRRDQLKDVPEHLQGIVDLLHEVDNHADFQLSAPRFNERCALKTLAEAMVRDSFGCPPKTNIGFYAGWKVIVVVPQDQVGYAA